MTLPRLAILLAATLAPVAGAQTTLFHETFESGLGNWTVHPTTPVSRWHLAAEGSVCGAQVDPFPSSATAARFGNGASTLLCNFNGTAAGDLTLAAPISIPAGAQHVRLHYWSFEETECPTGWWIAGNCGWDHRFVSVSTDGGQNWTDVALGGEELVWRQVSVDLSAFAGSDILLRFRFDPVDSVANDFAGWLIDEVRLEYGVPGPVTYCNSTTTGHGCTPTLFHTGTPSLSGPDDLVVGVRQIVNQRPARIIWGRATAATPFLGATLCIAPPIARTPIAFSGGSALPLMDCSGTHQFHFSHAYLADRFLSAGDTFYVQFSGRDPSKLAPNNRSSSGALQLTILP